MNFRTNITLSKEQNQIDYSSKLMLIGSCFSENISKKLSYFKFDIVSNPFGILFNPIAIEHLILNAIHLKTFSNEDVFYLNERWHCFDAHSDLSAVDKNELLTNLNSNIKNTHNQLKNCSHLIITFGTAWTYKNIEQDAIVGNCHKVPQKQFLKELLSVEEISASIEKITSLLSELNPSINIIFTVSPVRHLKDGFVNNMQSKAHLLAAIHKSIESKKQLYYFPSFEIMQDDLRDYRFYNKDMVHPNEVAIDYIWNQFQQVWINDNCLLTIKKVDNVQKGIAHKPFNKNSKQHLAFLEKLNQQIEELEHRFNIKF